MCVEWNECCMRGYYALSCSLDTPWSMVAVLHGSCSRPQPTLQSDSVPWSYRLHGNWFHCGALCRMMKSLHACNTQKTTKPNNRSTTPALSRAAATKRD